MNNRFRCCSLLILLFAGCASVPKPTAEYSTQDALTILYQCSEATDGSALDKISDISVQLQGEWNSLPSMLQPTLVDDKFRGGSQERYLVHEQIIAQAHTGPGGTKYVYRAPGTIHVWYNGQETDDKDKRDAAALVADGYRMFLLGPKFFLERNATITRLGTETVEHNICDNLLAELKPGIGNSAEDRAIFSIDQKTHVIRRYRMTLQGLEGTNTAVADIFPRNYIRIAGVMWPTEYYEELKKPVDTAVHTWYLQGIDFDRGLTKDQLKGPQFPSATQPAGFVVSK